MLESFEFVNQIMGRISVFLNATGELISGYNFHCIVLIAFISVLFRRLEHVTERTPAEFLMEGVLVYFPLIFCWSIGDCISHDDFLIEGWLVLQRVDHSAVTGSNLPLTVGLGVVPRVHLLMDYKLVQTEKVVSNYALLRGLLLLAKHLINRFLEGLVG